MSDTKTNGGPAFPRPGTPGTYAASQEGMTLRDYFAAKAMQGFLAECANPRFGTTHEPPNTKHWDAFSADAYALADAMLRAREK